LVGQTAQLVALACHFNGRVCGFRPVSFFPSNSTCKFCEQVHFVRQFHAWFGRRATPAIAAQTPDEWLGREARPGRKAVVLHQRINDSRISDRMPAGFAGGGGRWQLNITDERRMDVWEANWEVGNRKAPDQRIWRVRYSLVAENVNFVLPTLRSPVVIMPALRQALSDILAFCDQHRIFLEQACGGNDTFGNCFRKAIECLSAEDPFALAYHKDLAPEGLLSSSARQVLAACQAAWVFGGMGSWNDMAFEGQEQGRYEKLSDALFTLLNEAIQSSANSAADFGNSSPKD